MPSVALLPALALVTGAALALALSSPPERWLPVMILAAAAAAASWWRGWARLTTAALVVGFAAGGGGLAAHARREALHTPLRHVLDVEFGGFDIETLGPGGRHEPLPTVAVIREDAVPRDGFVAVRVDVRQVRVGRRWRPAAGGVTLSVSGAPSPERLRAWRAGRTIEAPVTFRRPARYLDDGVPDFERDLALDGTTLLGSVKSGLLVQVHQPGSPLAEAAAEARARVRRAVDRRVGARDPTSGAITAAVLIGDRTSIPADVRDRLQAAGTYHVIAISGGNIAVFVALAAGLCAVAGLTGRRGALLTMLAVTGYAGLVVPGPSVWRATLVAFVYLGARALDHRASGWHSTAAACAVMLAIWPLDLRNTGFELTFGATAALLWAGARPWAPRRWPGWARWTVTVVVTSLAVEVALLPVQARAFSRVTLAGLVLNLFAVPLMGVVQVSGLATVVLDAAGPGAASAGWVAHAAARLLVASTDLLQVAPWLSWRVPAPSLALVLAYYLALGLAWAVPARGRPAAWAAWCATVLAMVAGGPMPLARFPWPAEPPVRLSVFDVGQGEALLLEAPGSAGLLVDTGGSAFGEGLDIGARVLAPALWSHGVRRLQALAITHADPDHAGGAEAIINSVGVPSAWFGIEVEGHALTSRVLAVLRGRGATVTARRAGERVDVGPVRLRVLHPPEPDWRRPRVRNDDSLVIEAVYGEVAMLLTGDVSAEVERALVPQLTPARLRILKVAHHGSRTSTSEALLEAWRPQLALISCGRGNSFGHPSADVLDRLQDAGARVLRTDRDGQLSIETDGHTVSFRTYTGVRGRLSTATSRLSPAATPPPSRPASTPAARRRGRRTRAPSARSAR